MLHERFQKYGDEAPKLFERFVRLVLQDFHPEWSKIFTRVLSWSDWVRERNLPSQEGRDTGIDLVGLEKGGETWGIQVKLWEKPVTWTNLGSFVADLEVYKFKGGILVSPSGVTQEAENKLASLSRRVIILKEEDLLAGLDFDSLDPENLKKLKRKKPLNLRPYQQEALQKISEGLKTGGRGKLIMPPGTGKTLVALRAIEELLKPGEVAVFFTPSIALLDQTLRVFEENSLKPMRFLAVVSDKGVGRTDEDTLSKLSLLHIPPTTNPEDLAKALADPFEGLTVIFSTYQSSEVLESAQKEYGVNPFAIMVMDEAHRTAVARIKGQESPFTMVHKDERIRALRRLYMTATPRIYEVRGLENNSKKTTKANPFANLEKEEVQVEVYSMDNEEIFGPTLYEYTFAEAVREGYLSDYKVIVFGIPEEVQERLHSYLFKPEALTIEETLKAVGLWRVLQGYVEGEKVDFKRVIVFNPSIKRSKALQKELVTVAEAAREAEVFTEPDSKKVEINHIDGTFSAYDRRRLLTWLAGEEPDQIRVLTNAKVLTEGIDVPALDGVVFMHPRDSVVDVIQAVGRVMRKAPGKNYGYVILPVIIQGKDEGAELEKAGYRTVWQVLSALRAVDKTFDARTRAVLVSGTKGASHGEYSTGDTTKPLVIKEDEAPYFPVLFEGLLDEEKLKTIIPVIKGKLVKRLGLGQKYLEDWAKEVSEIAKRLQGVLRGAIQGNSEVRAKMATLLEALHTVVNEQIKEEEALLMLVQHLLTRPIFEALFGELKEAKKDPVTEALDNLWKTFEHLVSRETESLQALYESVRLKARGLVDKGERVEFLRRLYDTFFSKAFPDVADQMGIAYTPVPLVDYLVKSADELLQKHFGRGLESEGVFVLEPFAGTGTFLVRLLNHLGPEGTRAKLERGEIFGNEILLLPYHVMRANVEAEILDLTGEYRPFEGAILADSFRLAEYAYEKGGLPQIPLFPQIYSDRIKRQVESPIHVILSNPPWRAKAEREGQGRNVQYLKIRKRIEETYAKKTEVTNKNSLYDLYIHALRMATDRIEEGVIGLVTNNGWLTGKAARGLRASLVEEFEEVYVYDLRGDARTKGEERRDEGGNPFKNLTRSGVCLLLLVKKKVHKGQGKVFLYRVGDGLSAEAKLNEVKEYGSVSQTPWNEVPLEEWLGKETDLWRKMEPIEKVFNLWSRGVATLRDAYAFNPSKVDLEHHMKRLIDMYQDHVERAKRGEITKQNIDQMIEKDESLIKWDRELKNALLRGRVEPYDQGKIHPAHYRPFVPMNLYFSRVFNGMVYQNPRIWPAPDAENVCIALRYGGGSGPVAMATGRIVDVQFMFNGQVFPLYVYSDSFSDNRLFGSQIWQKTYNIKNDALKHFQELYGEVTPEDIFAYTYAVLSHPLYVETFAEDLKQGGLPRLPLPQTSEDFWKLVEAGKKLLKLHAEYEDLTPYPLQEEVKERAPEEPYERYRVEQMKLDEKNGVLKYNDWITLRGIPQEVFQWKPGGYDPLTWIVKYFKVKEKVKKGKGEAIVWDPNKVLMEKGNPRWLVEHIGRAVTAAVETVKIFREIEPILERLFAEPRGCP